MSLHAVFTPHLFKSCSYKLFSIKTNKELFFFGTSPFYMGSVRLGDFMGFRNYQQHLCVLRHFHGDKQSLKFGAKQLQAADIILC